MKNKAFYYTLLFILLLSSGSMAQSTAPSILWQKTVGGSATDSVSAFCVGANKSIIICGSSKSGVSGNKSSANIGGWDFWIVKMDSLGNVVWNKSYGGKKDDVAAAIIATSDGGYLAGGSSISDKDKVGAKTAASFKKSRDYWVIKLDANGNKVWDKTYGGIYTDKLTSLTQLPSGKYIAGGYSFSDIGGTKNSNNIGSENNADYWTLVLNSDGSVQSQALFGGVSMDALSCVAAAGPNTFYAAGHSYSIRAPGVKNLPAFGNNDYWLVRSDLSGVISYEGDFGGDRSDYLTSMQVLPDGSVLLGGYSNSSASFSKSEGFLGVTDFWLVKLKADGTKQWDKTIGGSAGDYLVSAQQTKDKGFILGGYSASNISNNKTENSRGGYDYWLVKTDSLGNVVWDKTVGGSGDDKLSAICELDTNQYIAVGTSGSPVSGDKTNGTIGSVGAADYWIVKLGATGSVNRMVSPAIAAIPAARSVSFAISPNPATNMLTVRYQSAGSRNMNLVIYSAAGKMVMNAAVPVAASGAYNVNVSGFAKGTYYAVMYTDKGKAVKPFIKE